MKLPKKLREARSRKKRAERAKVNMSEAEKILIEMLREQRRRAIRDRMYREGTAHWDDWIKRNPEGPK